MRTGRSMASLSLWLGPWTGAKVPGGVRRDELVLERGVRAYVYRGREPSGVYLVSPGLHYAGPDDPRLDRFCRVLARSGFVVVAPFLPDFLALRIAARAAEDLASAFAYAVALADDERLEGPAVFSISFGSRPAIELCASDAGERATALVMFGGFCDFDATVRFAVTGHAEHEGRRVDIPFDPLNAPVVHLNLLPYCDDSLDREVLAAALRGMVLATWGRPEMKLGRARAEHAVAIAASLRDAERAFFMTACGLGDDGVAFVNDALATARADLAWADPRPQLGRVRPPVVIVHGRDDDVIPWTEALKLESALRPSHPREVVLTGLYGHTGSAIPGARTIAREIAAMVRIVRLLAIAPQRGGLAARLRRTTATATR